MIVASDVDCWWALPLPSLSVDLLGPLRDDVTTTAVVTAVAVVIVMFGWHCLDLDTDVVNYDWYSCLNVNVLLKRDFF